MRFGTLQLCDEHARQSATQTSPEMAPFYPATEIPFYCAIDRRRRVRGELKRIEQRIADAGLMPDDCVIHQKAH